MSAALRSTANTECQAFRSREAGPRWSCVPRHRTRERGKHTGCVSPPVCGAATGPGSACWDPPKRSFWGGPWVPLARGQVLNLLTPAEGRPMLPSEPAIARRRRSRCLNSRPDPRGSPQSGSRPASQGRSLRREAPKAWWRRGPRNVAPPPPSGPGETQSSSKSC